MKTMLQLLLAGLLLLFAGTGIAVAQEGGTINTMTVNPRQNADMTNSTGTETGQPSDAVPGSQYEPNGLNPVTSRMSGGGTYVNMGQNVPANQPAHPETVQPPPRSNTPPSQTKAAAKRQK